MLATRTANRFGQALGPHEVQVVAGSCGGDGDNGQLTINDALESRLDFHAGAAARDTEAKRLPCK